MFKKITSALLVLIFSILFASPANAFDPSEIFRGDWLSKIVNSVENKSGEKVTQNQIRKEVVKRVAKRKTAPKNDAARMTPEMGVFLDRLVSEKKITLAQKNAILAEMELLKRKYGAEAMKGLTEREKKQKMAELQKDLADWAKTQGVDLEKMLPLGMMGLVMRSQIK